jgi:Short C-terminal domain
MRRVGNSRSDLIGVLARPPCIGGEQHGWADSVVDPVDQIEELADLCRRGLLSAAEFERQKAKVLNS